MIFLSRDELYHYGTKGQKWHQRRYQNPDGTWTEIGKQRRRKGSGKRIGNYNLEDFDADGNGDISDDELKELQFRSVLNYSTDAGNRLTSAYSLLKSKKEKGENINYVKYKEEMEKLSDDELRKIVNRLNTENSYVKLKSERDMSKGKKIAMNALKGTAAVITLGASAVTLIHNGKQVLGPILKKL